MATSFGLAGATTASAAAPALEIKNGATWTLFPTNSPCEYDVFNTSTHHFSSDIGGDKGTWSGGGSTIKMKWTHGANKGATFIGILVGTSPTYYQGKFDGTGATTVF